MRRIGFMMACGALALGCGGREGGDEDGGGIVLMDSGRGFDAGMVEEDDAGMVVTGCSVAGATGFPELPDGCLPRCAAATDSCIGNCGNDNACAVACIEDDSTPPESIDFGMGMSESINCLDCVNWGFNHCLFTSCPEAFAGCINCADACDDTTAGCETEEAALASCQMANATAIQGCFGTQLGRCF
jgi:hypothetical protein